MATKAIWWSITINNPTEEDRSRLTSPPEWVQRVIRQDEQGEGEGTLHIQGAVQCRGQQRFSRIKEWLPRAHIEAARNVQALQEYVKKENTAVPGTQVDETNVRSYVSPAEFPSWLANQYWIRAGARLGSVQGSASHQAEWTVRQIVAEGEINILHLWSQASLRRVTIEFWDTMIHRIVPDYPEWLAQILANEHP